MQREIKFRAWDKVLKTMYYDGNLPNGDVMVMDFSGGLQFSNNEGTWHKDDFILLQFTGLHDKNGKEIYEGDIVKFYQYVIQNNKEYKREDLIMKVIFKNGSFLLSNKDETITSYSPNESWEFIGNIYEKPELLK